MKFTLFALLLLFICAVTCAEEMTEEHHEIAVKVPTGTDPDELAKRYGYVNKGRIGTLDGYYLFDLLDEHKRTDQAQVKASALLDAEELEWAEKQAPKERHPRPHGMGGRRKAENF